MQWFMGGDLQRALRRATATALTLSSLGISLRPALPLLWRR